MPFRCRQGKRAFKELADAGPVVWLNQDGWIRARAILTGVSAAGHPFDPVASMPTMISRSLHGLLLRRQFVHAVARQS
jgi:hypothetical protein